MKKKSLLIVFVLVISLCLTLLAACNGVDYIVLDSVLDQIKQENPVNTSANTSYELKATTTYLNEKGKEVTFNIRWTVSGNDAITCRKSGSIYTVEIPQGLTNAQYTLKATVIDSKNNPYTDQDGNEYSAIYVCTIGNGGGNQGGNQGGDSGGNQGGNQGGNTGGSQVEGNIITVDFGQNFSTYANSWDTAYTTRTLSSADLGVSSVNFSLSIDASNQGKSTASVNIKDLPVMRPNGTQQALVVTMTDKTVSAFTVNLREWAENKKFTTLALEYSTDGINWTQCAGFADGTAKSVSEGYATLTASNLPSGVKYIRFVCHNSTIGSDGKPYKSQVGVAGMSITVNQ